MYIHRHVRVYAYGHHALLMWCDPRDSRATRRPRVCRSSQRSRFSVTDAPQRPGMVMGGCFCCKQVGGHDPSCQFSREQTRHRREGFSVADTPDVCQSPSDNPSRFVGHVAGVCTQWADSGDSGDSRGSGSYTRSVRARYNPNPLAHITLWDDTDDEPEKTLHFCTIERQEDPYPWATARANDVDGRHETTLDFIKELNC